MDKLSNPTFKMKKMFNLILVLGLAVFAAQTAWTQDEVPPPMPDSQSFSSQQLDQLLGPIALYPDPLLSVMLPAATFPTEIVEADRYISNGGDPNQIDQQPWDPSVQAMARYPSVLQWMDENLNWTTQVGQAFQSQQDDVMASVQRLRLMAYNLGNLQSTPQQQVVNDNGYIEINPVSQDNLYVPNYQPDQVYYQTPYGAPFIVFTTGYAIGPWLWCDFDWHNHRVVYWNHQHPRPTNWWHQSPAQRNAYLARKTNVWRPSNRPVYGGDRGWNNAPRGWTPAPSRPQPTLSGHPQSTLSGTPQPTLGVQHRAPINPPPQNNQWNNQRAQNNNWNPPVVSRPPPAPTENQRSQNNAFIGIQSAQDTRDFSQRGQQSMQSGGNAPEPRSAPQQAAPSGGGGGGFHGGGGGGGGGGRR